MHWLLISVSIVLLGRIGATEWLPITSKVPSKVNPNVTSSPSKAYSTSLNLKKIVSNTGLPNYTTHSSQKRSTVPSPNKIRFTVPSPDNKLPCYICIRRGGFISIVNITVRMLCSKGCGPGTAPSTKRITTTITTTKATVATTTRRITTSEATTFAREVTDESIQHILQGRTQQEDVDIEKSTMPKTVYLWVLAGVLTVSVALSVLVIVWKLSRMVERNRIGSIGIQSHSKFEGHIYVIN